MRLRELIEAPVKSSWLSDITLVKGRNGDVTMALENGRRYSVKGVGSRLYYNWVSAPSKGKFWHENIKNKFQVTRLI